MSAETKELVAEQPIAPLSAAVMEQVLLGGDLAKLTPEQRLNYYRSVCESLGLNPLTKPFDYLTLNDKLVLYAKKDCTDQLRSNRQISIQITDRTIDGSLCLVTARATIPETGRTDESIGAVPLVKPEGEWKTAASGKRYFATTGNTVPLLPDERANAMMKAETKAKRRATLSICGLGILDESELETIPSAVPAKPLEVTQTPEIDAEASQQACMELKEKMILAREQGDGNALEAIGSYLAKNGHLLTSADLASLRTEFKRNKDLLTKGGKK